MAGQHRARAIVVGVVALVVAGCGAQGSASSAATSVPSAPMSAPAAMPTATPAPSPVGDAAPGLTVDCAPLADDAATCLAVVGVAASGLGVDHPPVVAVAVRPLEPDATPAPSPSPLPTPASSPAVEIETSTLAYWVGFAWAGGAMSVPVSQTAAGWLPGLPLAATRVYRVPLATRSWTEPVPFALRAGEYDLNGGCSGSGSTRGGATVVLQRLRGDGTVLADAHRVRCGPVELTSVFGDKVTLEAGLYRLAVESNTGSLEVQLEPTATSG